MLLFGNFLTYLQYQHSNDTSNVDTVLEKLREKQNLIREILICISCVSDKVIRVTICYIVRYTIMSILTRLQHSGKKMYWHMCQIQKHVHIKRVKIQDRTEKMFLLRTLYGY